MSDDWRQTACILCSVNCCIEVQARGRPHRPGARRPCASRSRGYACEKAQRPTLPERAPSTDETAAATRRWQLRGDRLGYAIREVAARLVHVRDAYGGPSIFYYGGGGRETISVVRTAARRGEARSIYTSNAAAQENRRVSGSTASSTSARAATHRDFERAGGGDVRRQEPVAVAWLPACPRDPAGDRRRRRPRAHRDRSAADRDAELADHHLQVRPGTDAFCLSAIPASGARGPDRARLPARPHPQPRAALRRAPRDPGRGVCRAPASRRTWCVRSARRIAAAASVRSSRISASKQAPHSTLNSISRS